MTKRIPAGDSKVCVAYLRVSTDTDKQALGVEAQRQAIISWADRSGVEVLQWFVEEVSGGAALDKRPVLLEAIATAAALGVGRFVVQRLDRFSRDPLTAALAETELRKSGIALDCADGAGSGSDPTSELLRSILFAVARFEKSMITTRIKAALAVKKSRGELTGKAPYGMRRGPDGKTLVVDEAEAATAAQVRALRASGLTVRAVQAQAAQRGLTGRAGTPLSTLAIHKICSH